MKVETIRKYMAGAITQIINTVLPPRCLISGDIVDQQGALAPQSWRELDFISDPLCACCGLSFEYEIGTDTLCAHCMEYKPEYDQARASLKYNDMSKKLILGFKHGDQMHAVRCFTPWLTVAGRQMISDCDMFVPVPLHRRRLIARRYNQAAVLGHALSKETGVMHVPECLQRLRATASQGTMNRQARRENVQDAFAVRPKYLDMIQGKSIIVLDDVYTTGATVNECAKVLKSNGAARVNVLTIARVITDQ